MEDREVTKVFHYPVYFIAKDDGNELWAVPYEGRVCLLTYQNLEVAELYCDQVGDKELCICVINSQDEFLTMLKAVPMQVTHLAWNVTVKPSAVYLEQIAELLLVLPN